MQYYVDPIGVFTPEGTRNPTRSLRRILERDGQIVPVLVRRLDGGTFMAADRNQGIRVLAFRDLGWPTILIEDSWSPEDL